MARKNRRNPNFPERETNAQLTIQQAEQLIDVYNRYRHVFSDTPGKVRDYQCEIQFREPVNLIKKILPDRIFIEGSGENRNQSVNSRRHN